MLQTLKIDKLPQLQQVLCNIKILTTVVQLISSHCGVLGNEQAYKLAKYGAEKKEENPFCFTEMKTTINKPVTISQQDLNIHLYLD